MAHGMQITNFITSTYDNYKGTTITIPKEGHTLEDWKEKLVLPLV